MARRRTIEDTERARKVFRECMEEFSSRDGNKKMWMVVKSEGKRTLSKLNLSKVKSIQEDDVCLLNKTVPESHSLSFFHCRTTLT